MLPHAFFQRDPVTCARELIGCELAWGECAGRIVETEAYTAENDEACHTFFRAAARQFVAVHRAGTAYVYLNYGMHWLLNVLVKGGSEDGFVLIRAVEPTRGLEQMLARRGRMALTNLCSGPGKLTQAFGIGKTDHGRDLCAGAVGFVAADAPAQVVADLRIGISRAVDFPWRFLLAGSPHISVPPRLGVPGLPVRKKKRARPAKR